MKMNAGFGKTEIKFPEFNIGMMGYGQPNNIAKTQATPMYARTICLKENEKIIILNVVELCFVSIALKAAVVDELKILLPKYSWNHDNVLLSAQHTHSAPGGYSHYPMWNFTIPGFRPKTFKAIKDAIIYSIITSIENSQPVNIYHGCHSIDASVPIALNRSIPAAKNNPEYARNIFDPKNPIDRKMNVLHFSSLDGKILGCINLFGVHATSVPNRNTAIHSDNKGMAATFWKKNFLSCCTFCTSNCWRRQS